MTNTQVQKLYSDSSKGFHVAVLYYKKNYDYKVLSKIYNNHLFWKREKEKQQQQNPNTH